MRLEHKFVTQIRLLLVVMIFSVTSPVTWAQLALIRQGPESTGEIEEGDRHGAAVALGDFDGDGYDDLATGAPAEGYVTSTEWTGTVYINRGSPYGLTWEDAYMLSPFDAGLPIFEAHRMGASLAVGNFDGDDYDDLAIGLPASRVNGNSNAGRVLVYYGGPSGLSSSDLLVIDQTHLGADAESGDLFGTSLAAGRLGSDDYDDLAIGSVGENGVRGVVSIIRGSGTGLQFNQIEHVFGGDLGKVSEPGDQFGFSLAIGDVMGTPAGELIVGAPFTMGEGNIVFGGVAYVASATDNIIQQPTAQVITPWDVGDGIFPNGRFGFALAVGDFRDNGTNRDLAIGAPGAQGSGRVYIGHGGVFGIDWQSTGLAHPSIFAPAGDDFGRALATGDHDFDGDDELVVGCPFDDSSVQDAGSVHIFDGSPGGLSQSSVASYLDSDLGEYVPDGGLFGSSLAAGRTSSSQRLSIAVGAPRKLNFTGEVYDIAPWRQVPDPLCRSALAVDCEDNIIYALRPFEQLMVASTTKIMTVLLGCEATQPGAPIPVGLDDSYTIQQWMYDGFPLTSGCSIFGFTPTPSFAPESYTFEELLYICFPPSGNDVTYAIADAITGEITAASATDFSNSVDAAPEFVEMMNDRAAVIGMNDTLFTNPAGTDGGSPFSTAYDMWLLGKEAMANPFFREIAGTTTYSVDKVIPTGSEATSSVTTANVPVNYGWLTSLQALTPTAVGIKPGNTPGAGRTRVAAAEWSPDNLVYATGFGWSGSSGEANQTTADLLDLALAFSSCAETNPNIPMGPSDVLPGDQQGAESHRWVLNDGRVEALQLTNFGSSSTDPDGNAVANPIDLSMWQDSFGSESTDGKLRVQYRGMWKLPSGEECLVAKWVNAGTVPFRSISAMEQRILLISEDGHSRLTDAEVQSRFGSGRAQTHRLSPNKVVNLPDWEGKDAFELYLTNTSEDDILVTFAGVFEFEFTFGGGKGEFVRFHFCPDSMSFRDGFLFSEVESSGAKSSSPLAVRVVLEDRKSGNTFRVVPKASFSSIGSSGLTDDITIDFDTPEWIPLRAFYDTFQIESATSLRHDESRRLDWEVAGEVRVDDSSDYSWSHSFPSTDRRFFRIRPVAQGSE